MGEIQYTPPKEFMDKLREKGDIPLGVLYIRMKDEKLVLAPVMEIGFDVAGVILSKWNLRGLVDGRGK